MKIRNPAPLRPERQIRGISSGLRAGIRGITIRDEAGNDVHPTLDVLFRGATVEELDDDTALVSIGGASGPGGGASSGTAVVMLNNSGQDLNTGDVVVVDETADRAVTITTTEGDTHIAGVVAEPIEVDGHGRVLFNGYAALVNASGVARGEYAKTSTTGAIATSSADREAGSFAVYLTGDDFSEFVTAAATTEQEIPTTSIAIDMPPTVPAGQLLFLALWLEDAASSPSVTDFNLIGATSGFYYYTKVSEGADTATASWTGASLAVASVLILDPSVALPVPIEDFDYDDTTSAASVSALSDAARYAIAGVQSDVTTPGSGFTRLAGGTAGFVSGGTPTLVQSKHGDGGATGTSFDSNPTLGNMLVAIPSVGASGLPATIDLYDPRDPGPCPAVTDWDLADQFFGATSGGGAMAIRTKIADDTYAGPFKTTATCTADSGRGRLTLMEFENVSAVAAVLTAADDQQNATIDLGTFSGYGSDDVIVMGVVFKKDGGGDPAVSFAAEGFTQLVDEEVGGGQFHWVGYKIGGSANAKVTHGGTVADWNWGAAAIHLTAGSSGVAGTLAGKYIGHDSSVTSPFSGAGKEDDAIFAFNLLTDAKPSALLYGPDLGGSGGTSVDAADVTFADADGLFTATDVEAALAELAKKDLGYQAHGTMGSTETFSALIGWHSGTFDDDCTFTFSGATSGIVASMVLELTGDGVSSGIYPGSVIWPGGVAPDPPGLGETVLQLFQSRDGGTTWFGFQAGAGGSSSVAALDDLSDVVVASVTQYDHLYFDGSSWVNTQATWKPVSTGDGGILYDAGTGDPIMAFGPP